MRNAPCTIEHGALHIGDLCMDTATKKTVLRLFTYGLYAITAKHGDEVSLMTANWIVQSSFDPPMLTLAAETDSHTRQLIGRLGHHSGMLNRTSKRFFGCINGLLSFVYPPNDEATHITIFYNT